LEVKFELPSNESLTVFLNHFKSKYVEREKEESESHYQERIKKSHLKRVAQAQRVGEYIDERFKNKHTKALYAVVGDFNDTPESPWVAPLLNSPRLTNILAKFRAPNDCWTYYWKSKNRVSQIDYILTSRALTKHIKNLTDNDPTKLPHIERRGLAYRKLNSSGLILPKQTNLIHFDEDPVTPKPNNTTPKEKIDFRFTRYTEVMQNWRSHISDHCPVKVWF